MCPELAGSVLFIVFPPLPIEPPRCGQSTVTVYRHIALLLSLSSARFAHAYLASNVSVSDSELFSEVENGVQERSGKSTR